jgi:signal peptidase II
MLNKKLFYVCFAIILFAVDRVSKLYILNLAEINQSVDIYVNSFLNFYLIWNTGIGFGLLSSDINFFYNIITSLIVVINIIILIMIFRSKNYKIFFLILILSGSLGNLFDRLYYNAVPDFIDVHYKSFHWFVFNVADIFISIGIICLILTEIIFNKDT